MTVEPRSMDCRDCVGALYEYLDRELTPDVRAQIEHHLRSCAGCFRHFEFERAFLRFLEARARGRGAGPHVKRRLIQQLFQSEDT